MKVPLLCDLGTNDLTLVSNGTATNVELPFKPHMYVKAVIPDRYSLKRIEVGSNEEVHIDKITTNDLLEFGKKYMETDCHRLRYIEQIYAEDPKFFLQYPNTDKLKIMVMDIEVYTDGSGIFPNSNTNPIVAIGLKIIGDPHAYIFDVTENEMKNQLPDRRRS